MKRIGLFFFFTILVLILFVVGLGIGYAVAAGDWQAPLIKVGLVEEPTPAPRTPPRQPAPEEPMPTDQPATEEATFCTMEALECPDGSYVGRQGPNCEFAPCPGAEASGSARVSGTTTATSSTKLNLAPVATGAAKLPSR